MPEMKPDKYDCLKLENQLCFPLYACSKEIVRRYKARVIQKLNLVRPIVRRRQDSIPKGFIFFLTAVCIREKLVYFVFSHSLSLRSI